MATRKKVTWIGNTSPGHRELHRIEEGKDQPVGCQFNEIAEKNRKVFPTAKAALKGKPKFDACSFCTKRFKSRR